MNPRWRLQPRQMWAWAVASYLGLGYFLLPRVLYEHAGYAALYALLLGLAASFLSIHLTARAAERLPGCSLVQVAKTVLGKWPGIAFETWPFLYQLLINAAAFRALADIIHTVNLQRTPEPAILAVSAVVVGTVAWYGVEAVTRLMEVWLPVVLGLIAFALALSVQNVDLALARPHFTGWADVWDGFVHHFFVYGGIASNAIVLAYVDARRALPWLHLGVGINSMLLLAAFLSVAATVGPFVALDVTWPVIYALRLVDIRGFVVERTGSLVLLGYTVFIVLYLVGLVLTTSVALTHQFGVRDDRYRYFVPVVTVVTAAAALWVPDRPTLEAWLTGVLSYGGFYIALFKPLVLYAAARLRGIGPGSGAAARVEPGGAGGRAGDARGHPGHGIRDGGD